MGGLTLRDDDYVVVLIHNQDESYSNESNLSFKWEVSSVNSDQSNIAENENIDNEIHYLDENLFKTEDSKVPNKNKKTKTSSRWQLRPENHYSYIEELRRKHPECRLDEEKLVEKTRELMEKCKPDSPPDNFLTGTDTLKCSFCNSASKSMNEAKRHYQEKHGPRYLLCYACSTNFRSMTNLAKHEKKCLSIDAHIVLKARAKVVGLKGRNRPFIDLSLIRKRENNKTSNNNKQKYKKIFECPECGANFKSKCLLNSHLYFHQGKRPFLCSECPAAYTSKYSLNRHIKTHNPSIFICDTCKTKSTTKNSLIAHMNTHLPAKFACSYPGCNKRYSQKHTLVVHIDVDHNNKPLPFPCELCDLRFRRMYRLQVHMKNHHGLQIVTRNMLQKQLPTLQDPDEIKPKAAYVTSKKSLVWNSDHEMSINPTITTRRHKNDE